MNSKINIIRLFFFLFFLGNFTVCTAQKLPVTELPIERDGQRITVVKAEIARTDEDRSQGLMFRENLADGEGMLFVYERDQVLSFWMKNTLIPLSIAFIAADGRIIDIRDMYPHDESSVVSSRSVRYALEVPQGWFSRAGVLYGDIVNIDTLKN
jgi:uncharacterized membrane protein (UPF0127 family)